VTGSPANFKITGDLTMHGVTKPVTFTGKYLGTANDAWGNTKAAFDATAKIKRADWGLTWNKMVEVGPTVGDQVTLRLKLQAAKAK
jgi:polyisoprenoid-binding protein YceI